MLGINCIVTDLDLIFFLGFSPRSQCSPCATLLAHSHSSWPQANALSWPRLILWPPFSAETLCASPGCSFLSFNGTSLVGNWTGLDWRSNSSWLLTHNCQLGQRRLGHYDNWQCTKKKKIKKKEQRSRANSFDAWPWGQKNN